MSDPMTNLEIQDVLSSIRRLVSEDSRHKPQPDKARAGERADKGSAAASDSKLVLTDALRVPEAEADEAALPTGEDTLRQSVAGDGVFDDAEPLPEADVALPDGNALLRDWETDSATEAADAQSLEDTIAELEAAVAGIGGEFEPDGSEVAKGTPPDAALEDAFEDGFAVDEAAEAESAELAQPVTSGDLRSRSDLDETVEDTPEAPVTEDDAAEDVEMAAHDGAADHAEADVDAGLAEDEISSWPEPEDAPDDLPELAADGDADLPDGAEDEGSDEPTGPVPPFVHGGSLRSAPPAAEAGPVPTGPVRRLTLTAADAVPGGPARWERDDAAEAEPLIHGGSEADQDDDGDGDDAVGLFSAGDEAVIDMDMLRDLVAEMIREELQGPLGERITRNVRMLVRREINRALESRQLD